MNETSLRSMIGHAGVVRKPAADSPGESEPEYQAASYGRVGLRPQVMLEIAQASGYREVLPYIDLRGIATSDPKRGFELRFSDQKWIVQGQNLDVCYRYLKQNRLEALQEASRTEVLSMPPDVPLIHSIRVIKK